VGPIVGLDALEKANILPLVGFEPRFLEGPAHSLVTTVTAILKIYRVIQNDCWGFNNLSYTIHLRQEYMCFFLFNRTTLQVFVTCLKGAPYVNPLWFYKHQHDNRVRSKLFVACQRWWFQWRFWFLHSVPRYLREEEEHKHLDPPVQLHTPISSILCKTIC